MRWWMLWVFPFASLWGVEALHLSDVLPSVQAMLDCHVEYHTFDERVAKRTARLYVEQFDPEKIYLTLEEARPYLSMSSEWTKNLIDRFKRGDFADFKRMEALTDKAIQRARKVRATLMTELRDNWAGGEADEAVSYVDFAKNEGELRERMRVQLVRMLANEKKLSQTRSWGEREQGLALALAERRLRRLEERYLAGPLEHSLAMHILRAFAKSLDAHTSYFTPEEALSMRVSLEKQFEGFGVVFREGIYGISIIQLIPSSPAALCGKILPGDLLTKINGQDVREVPYEEVLSLLQAQERVRLQCSRWEGDKHCEYEVDLKKQKIVMQEDRVTYSWEPFADGIIGKIVLPSFYEYGEALSCERDLREALRALKKEGKLLGIVLDMRENSGGFLSQAVKVGGLFISSGVVVISKYARGKIQYLRDLDGRLYYDGPLLILTSRGSASAAEIVAQALQDYGVALVVGDDRTFGKGTIQYQTVTDPRASSFFKVTVGRYYTVSGRSTQIEGVKADVQIPTVLSGYQIGERYLRYPLQTDHVPAAYEDSLSDLDRKDQLWFEHNYLPNVQKQLSVWTQMISRLKENNAYRIAHDSDYELFLKTLPEQVQGRYVPTATHNFGGEDLQMKESIQLIKDMVFLSCKK